MAAGLCFWSRRDAPLRAMHARFTMWPGRSTPYWGGGLDAALEQQFNLIASYVALAIECGAVFVVAFGALQAISALFRGDRNRPGDGDRRTPNLAPLRHLDIARAWNLRSPPTSCARRWRRPGTTSA